MDMYKSHKGQLFAQDLIAAITLFSLALALIFMTWHELKQRTQDLERINQLENIAYTLTQQLTLTPGSPVKWEKYLNATSIGLAKNPYILDAEKIKALKNNPQLIENQNYKITLKNSKNQILLEFGVYDGLGDMIQSSKPVIYLNETATLDLTVYG